MSVDTVIKKCKVVSPSGVLDAGLAVDKGKIVAISRDQNLPPAERVIDAMGNTPQEFLLRLISRLKPRLVPLAGAPLLFIYWHRLMIFRKVLKNLLNPMRNMLILTYRLAPAFTPRKI